MGKREQLMESGVKTKGRVSKVHTCWYIKVNTKPVRAHALDGATFPHIVTVAYEADGTAYTVRRCLAAGDRCPMVGEAVAVYYDPARPKRAVAVVETGRTL